MACLLGVLTGCQNEEMKPEEMIETKSVVSGDYRTQLPFTANDSRQKHAFTTRSLQDSMYIGTGLMDLSKEHFSPNDYVMQEGKFLDYAVLDSSDGSTGLLGRKSDSNPIGLNPAKGTQFDTGNGMLSDPVLVNDVYEIDFLKSGEVKGISLAIILNNKFDKTTISDDKLLEYGSSIGATLEEYMRTIEGIDENMPILITLYKNSSTDDALPGSFFAKSFYNKNKPSYTAVKEEWVMFNSSRADELDSITAGQFSSISDTIHDFLVEDVNMIGKGKFVDGVLSDLRITVTTYAKTGTEAKALSQYLQTLLEGFTSQDFRIRLELKVDNENISLMERQKGESAVKVIEFI